MREHTTDELYIRALKGRADVRQFVGQIDPAIADYRSLIGFCEQTGTPDPSAVPDAMLCIGYILDEDKNDFAGAKRIVARALTRIDAYRKPILYADGVCLLGLIARRQGDYQKALGYFRDVYARQMKARNQRGMAAVLNNFGNVYWNMGEFKKSLAYYHRSLAIAERIHLSNTTSAALGNIGLVYSDMGEFSRAFRYYKKDLANCQRTGNKWGLVIGYENIGALHLDLGDTDRAMDYYVKSLAMAEEIGFRTGISRALEGLGLACIEKSELDRALVHLRKSLALSERIGDTSGIGCAFEGIGQIFFIKGDLRRAFDYFKRDRAIKQRLGNKNGLGIADMNLGKWATEHGKMTAAHHYYDRAERVLRVVGNKFALTKVLALRAELDATRLRLTSAFERTTKALDLARGIGTRVYEIVALRSLGKVYSAWFLLGGNKKMPRAFYPAGARKGMNWAVRRAIVYLKRSVVLARKHNRPIELARSLHELSSILERTGKYRAADACRQEAIAICKKTGARLWLRKMT